MKTIWKRIRVDGAWMVKRNSLNYSLIAHCSLSHKMHFSSWETTGEKLSLTVISQNSQNLFFQLDKYVMAGENKALFSPGDG